MLRQLSSYYYKEPTLLYLVRLGALVWGPALGQKGAHRTFLVGQRAASGLNGPQEALPARFFLHVRSQTLSCAKAPPVFVQALLSFGDAHTLGIPENSPQVRTAQGLVHMGKGLMGLSPYHTERQLLSGVALAGLLAVVFSCEDAKATVVSR